MPQIIVNAQGTSSNSFSIGKRGVVIYQGSITPTNSLGNNGDVYIKKGTNCNILIKNEGEWVAIGDISQAPYPSVTSISTSQTIDFSGPEGFCLVDTTDASVTVTLSNNLNVAGKRVTIKDSSGTTSSLFRNITVATEGAALIDGDSTVTINSNYSSITLISDGTNWHII